MLFEIKNNNLVVDNKVVATNARVNHDAKRKGLRAKCDIMCSGTPEPVDIRIDYALSLTNVKIQGVELIRNIKFSFDLKISLLRKSTINGNFGTTEINQTISSPAELINILRDEIEKLKKEANKNG